MHQIRKFFIEAFQIDIPTVRGDGTETDPYHLQLADVAQNGYYAELFATCWFRGMEAAVKRAVRWKIAERGMTPRGHYRLIIHQWIFGEQSFSVETLHFSCEPKTSLMWAPAITPDEHLVVPQKLGWATYLGMRDHEADDKGGGYSHGWRTEGFMVSVYVYAFDETKRRSAEEKKAGIREQIQLVIDALPPHGERTVTEFEGPSWMRDHAHSAQFDKDGADGLAHGLISVSYKKGLFFKVRVTIGAKVGELPPRAVVNDSFGAISAVFERLYLEGPDPSFDPQGWARSLLGKRP